MSTPNIWNIININISHPVPKKYKETLSKSFYEVIITLTPKSGKIAISSVQFSSVSQSCPTLCNPVNCNMPGLLVHHQLPEPTQTHVHWVGDVIQSSHLPSSHSPPALNLSQHLDLFNWVSYKIRKLEAKISDEHRYKKSFNKILAN